MPPFPTANTISDSPVTFPMLLPAVSPHKPLRWSLIFLVMVFLCSSASAMTASDKEKYEKKGLSQGEWQLVLNARMPEKKVDELLMAGISITEYFDYPWLKLKMSEKEWVHARESGLLDEDIRARNPSATLTHSAVVQNLLVPGLHQFRRKQKLKAWLMLGTALTGVSLVGLHALLEHEFKPAPFLLVGAASLWSSIDIGIQVRHESNPDAARFSCHYGHPLRVAVAARFSFPPR